MTIDTLSDHELNGKRVLMRVDFNVPFKDGEISSDARIRAALPGIRTALEAGARLLLMSHLGRPIEGQPELKYSLKPVAKRLGELLEMAVPLVTDYLEEAQIGRASCRGRV